MSYISTTFLLLTIGSAIGPNLIYNGSFEQYYSCPTGNDLGDGQLEKVFEWTKPTMGGINDVIDIQDLLGFNPEIRIMNRLGNPVAFLNRENPVWDGGNCPDGVYFYFLNCSIGHKTSQQSGFIHLLR